jgi:predicted nucleic acid-binding protein
MQEKRYVFDTNILFFILRNDNAKIIFENLFGVLGSENHYICSVTEAELYALARCNGWGAKRYQKIDVLVRHFSVLGVDHKHMQQVYAEVELYNRNLHPTHKNRKGQAYKMGKHDIWIATTAIVLDATVISTDHRAFSHFTPNFLKTQLFLPEGFQ